MTTYRIHATAKPTRQFGPVLPMEKDQARFWQLLSEKRSAQTKTAAASGGEG